MSGRRSSHRRTQHNASRDSIEEGGAPAFQLHFEELSGSQHLQLQQQQSLHSPSAPQRAGDVVSLLPVSSTTDHQHNNASFGSSLPPIRSPSVRSDSGADLRQQQQSAVSPSHVMAVVPHLGGSGVITPNTMALPPALAGSFASGPLSGGGSDGGAVLHRPNPATPSSNSNCALHGPHYATMPSPKSTTPTTCATATSTTGAGNVIVAPHQQLQQQELHQQHQHQEHHGAVGGGSSNSSSVVFGSPRRRLRVSVSNGNGGGGGSSGSHEEPPPTTTASAAVYSAHNSNGGGTSEHVSSSARGLAAALENSGSRSSLASPLGTYASFNQASLLFEQHGIPFQPLLNMTPVEARAHVEKVMEASPLVYTSECVSQFALDLVQAYFALRRSTTIGSPLERHHQGSISIGGVLVRGVTVTGESCDFDEGITMEELALNGSSTTSGVCGGTQHPSSGGVSLSSATVGGGSGPHHRSSVDSVRSVATQSHHRLDRRLSSVSGGPGDGSATSAPSAGKPPPSPHLREFPSIMTEDIGSSDPPSHSRTLPSPARVPASPSQLMPHKPSSGAASGSSSATLGSTPPRYTTAAVPMALPTTGAAPPPPCPDMSAGAASSFLTASMSMGHTTSVASARGDDLEMDSCRSDQHPHHDHHQAVATMEGDALVIATTPTATATEETEPSRPVADDDPNVASLQDGRSSHSRDDGEEEHHRSGQSSLAPLETTSTNAFNSSLPDEQVATAEGNTVGGAPLMELPVAVHAVMPLKKESSPSPPNHSLSPVPHSNEPEEETVVSEEPERSRSLAPEAIEATSEAAGASTAARPFELMSDTSNTYNNVSTRSDGISPRDSFEATAGGNLGGTAGWACSPSPLLPAAAGSASSATAAAMPPQRMPSWTFGGGFVQRQNDNASPNGVFLGGGRRRSTMIPSAAAGGAPSMEREGPPGEEIDLDVPRLFPDRRLSTRNTMPLLQYMQHTSVATTVPPSLPSSTSGGVVIAPPASSMGLSISNGTAVPVVDGAAVDPLEGSQTSVGSLRTQRRTVLTNNATVMSDEFGMTTVNDYVIEECLGRGSYGVVYSGTRLSDNEKVAIKCIKRTQLFRRAPHPAAEASCYASPVATHVVLPSSASPHSHSDTSITSGIGGILAGGGGVRSRSPSHLHNNQQQATNISNNTPSSHHQVVSIPSFHVPRAASPKRGSGGGGVSHYVRSLTEGNAQHADDFIFLDYSILKEVAIMKQINNRHLIRLYEAILDPTERLVYLVMQFVGGGCVLERTQPQQPEPHLGSGSGNANARSSPSSAPLGAASPKRVGGGRNGGGEDTDNGSGFLDDGFTSNEASSHERREARSWSAAAARGEAVYKPLPRNLILKYTRQIVSGLAYLHGKGILHRDIKPENILVDTSKKHAYLADFGVSEICRDGVKGDVGRVLIGTPYFMAPELFSDDPDVQLSGAVDVWALGVTMFAMATGRLPFYGAVEADIKASILTTEPVFLDSDGLDDDLQALMRAMMRKRPDERITIDQLRGQRIMMSSSSVRANSIVSPLGAHRSHHRNSATGGGDGGDGGGGNAMAVVEEMTNMTNSFCSPPLSFAPPTDSSPEQRSQNPRSRCGSLVDAFQHHPLAAGGEGSAATQGGRETTGRGGGEVTPMAPLEMPPPANSNQGGIYSTKQNNQDNHSKTQDGSRMEGGGSQQPPQSLGDATDQDDQDASTETSGDHYSSTPTTQGPDSMQQDQTVVAGLVVNRGTFRHHTTATAAATTDSDATGQQQPAPPAPTTHRGFDVSERQMQAAFRILLPTSSSMMSLPSSHAVSLTSSPQLPSYSTYGFR